MTTSAILDTRKTCTYAGDARDSVGQIKGPNAWGELLVVDEAVFTPPTGPGSRGVTRVWFRYATEQEMRAAAAVPQPDMASAAFDLPAWLAGPAGYVVVTCAGCGETTPQHGITDPAKAWALCPDCLNRPDAHAKIDAKRRELRAAAAAAEAAAEVADRTPPARPVDAGTAPVTIRIVGLASGEHTTPFDGQWLVEYDPTREGVDPDGQPMTAHIVTTPDRSQAATFPDAGAASQEWKRESGRPYPRNAPLTAFSIEVVPQDRPDGDAPDAFVPWDDTAPAADGG